MENNIKSASFKDQSGFVFRKNNEIYTQINQCHCEDFDFLMSSNLYRSLVTRELLIPHKEADLTVDMLECYKIIKPKQVPLISYPYEWSFSQLKNAALLTLFIQKAALDYGMTLNQASAYNIQFLNNRPVFTDILSFEKYKTYSHWAPYKQFCENFLAPLALMAYKDIRLNELLKLHLDGIALDLASSLLKKPSKFNFSVLTHIHMNAKGQKYSTGKVNPEEKQARVSLPGLKALINSLEFAVKSINLSEADLQWENYQSNTHYCDPCFKIKYDIVREYIRMLKPESLVDLNSNVGEYSRIASNKGVFTIAADSNPIAVEQNYQIAKRNKERNIMPILLDITNPSPAIGWANKQCEAFSNRISADTVMAIDLIHHLSITNSLPFENTAEYFSQLGNSLIIEFIPKSDPKVQNLLACKKDSFANYSSEYFEHSFGKYYDIKEARSIPSCKSTIYLMIKKQG